VDRTALTFECRTEFHKGRPGWVSVETPFPAPCSIQGSPVFPISELEILVCDHHMQGQNLTLLFKLAIEKALRFSPRNYLRICSSPPSEVSKALKRCVHAGLLYISGSEKRVNRTGLIEFLSHGLRYVFPAAHGSTVRGSEGASLRVSMELMRHSTPEMSWELMPRQWARKKERLPARSLCGYSRRQKSLDGVIVPMPIRDQSLFPNS
jgi:hypothetical protein